MKKVTFIMVFITIILSFGMTIFQSPLLANTESKKNEFRDIYLNIITVNKPQAEMVKRIIGNKHNVEYMITDEKDIKNFEFDDDVVKNVSNMDLFIYTGTDFEPWISNFISKLKKGNLGIINLSRGIRLLNFDNNGDVKENPYYFEGIEEYKIALYNIKNSIQDKDPKNRDYYEENYNKSIKEFDKQISYYNKHINALKNYNFVILDNRFDYIAKSLNLSTIKLQNNDINDLVKEKNLDPEKVVIIQDGDDLVDINTVIDIDSMRTEGTESNPEAKYYKTVELWKYYGNMSFDDLILYNIKELSNIVESDSSNNTDNDLVEEVK